MCVPYVQECALCVEVEYICPIESLDMCVPFGIPTKVNNLVIEGIGGRYFQGRGDKKKLCKQLRGIMEQKGLYLGGGQESRVESIGYMAVSDRQVAPETDLLASL